MKVKLRNRHFGIHQPVRDCEVPGSFSDYAAPKPDSTDPDDCKVNEGKLLSALPAAFLPLPPSRVLLAVEDDAGGTGQTGLSMFRNWAKYFDAYVISLVRDGAEEPGREQPK